MIARGQNPVGGERKQQDKKFESRLRQEQRRDFFKNLARHAEGVLDILEQNADSVPVAKKLIQGAREKIREIRARSTEAGVLASIEYGKEVLGQQKEVFMRTCAEETVTLDAVLKNPGLFESRIGELMHQIAGFDTLIAVKKIPETEKSLTDPQNQREYYKSERTKIQRIVDVYLDQLRKDALRGPLEKKTVTELAEEIIQKGMEKNPNLSWERKEEYVSRVIRAHAQREAERDHVILSHAKMIVLENFIKGSYVSDADPLKAARKDFLALVQRDGISPSEEFPPDMSFLYGHAVMDRADQMDHIEAFMMEMMKDKKE